MSVSYQYEEEMCETDQNFKLSRSQQQEMENGKWVISKDAAGNEIGQKWQKMVYALRSNSINVETEV